LAAGGTRGAGRGIAVELGAAGATVYVTGRTSRVQSSEDARPETIEETAELVTASGGSGVHGGMGHRRWRLLPRRLALRSGRSRMRI